MKQDSKSDAQHGFETLEDFRKALKEFESERVKINSELQKKDELLRRLNYIIADLEVLYYEIDNR